MPFLYSLEKLCSGYYGQLSNISEHNILSEIEIW